MKKLIVLILAIPFLFASCDNGGISLKRKGSIDMNFKATYDGAPMVLGDFYDYPSGQGHRITFQVFNFFVSEVQLGAEDKVEDAIFFDFRENHSAASTAPNGESFVIENIPAGDYSSLNFGVGISAALNATNPADYRSDEALSNTSMYWDWRGSYIFAMIEGGIDTTGDGLINVPFTYHMGSDALFRDASFSNPITIERGTATPLNFGVDLKDVLVKDGTAFDIAGASSSHTGTDDEAIAQELMTNLTDALTLLD